MPPADLAGFLTLLHPPGSGYTELRALPSKAQAFVEAGDVAGAAAFLATHTHEDCYVGVATRRTPGTGTLTNCQALWVVFVDVDFKTTPESEARVALGACPLAPTMTIHSGGGLHVYWQLREPIALPEEADTARVLLRRLARHFGADLASAEPARILRVPGSRNHKPVYLTPRPVVIEALEAGA